MPQRGVTISLAAEAQSVTKCTQVPSEGYNANSGQTAMHEITGGNDLDPFITKTDTFSSSSIAVAACGCVIYAYAGISMKMRLFMAGVQVAESVNLTQGVEGYSSVMGSKALVGSQVVKITVHNYGATNNVFWTCANVGTTLMYPTLAIGCVKP